MYEALTDYLQTLEGNNSGEWIVDRQNDGSKEHPIHLPYVQYDRTVYDFVQAVYRFYDEHEEYEMRKYRDTVENLESATGARMWDIDVSLLDGKTVMAMILYVIRANRFVEGALLHHLRSGDIQKWLIRLEQIDRERYGSPTA